MKKQIEQSGQSLKRKLEQQRKKAESENLKDAKQLLQRLEEEAGKLGRQDQDRKQAMIKLNDLAQQLDKRQKELGGADKMQKQLNQLKDLGKGPADKFLNAVAKGDLKTAMQELEKLKQDLSKLSSQQREELAKQLDAMKQKLEKMVQQQKEAEEDLKKRIEQAKQAGQKEEAERLQEQLKKLQQQSTHLDRVQEMAKKLGQCSKCLQSGQTSQAGETLGDIGKDLDALQDQLEEFEMLDDAKSQIAQARDQMICPGCGGAGCGRCQGPPGQGLGTGKGYGDRPEEKDDVDFFDSRASVKVGKGAASLAGEVEGPNVKGNAQQVVKEQFEAARRAPADPLTSERIPKKQRQHAKEYFDHLREGR
jgi:DNA repair exonuclease SbcCD ATPase subunit